MSDIASHLQQLQQRAISDLEEKYSAYKALSVRSSQLIQIYEARIEDMMKELEKLNTEKNNLCKKVQELENEKLKVVDEVPQVLEVEEGELKQ